MPKRRANGEGNIRKRKDGRWEGRYTVGHDPETGKAIIKNVLGKTQAEVKEKLKKAIEENVGIDYGRAKTYTVGSWLEVWMENYAKVKLRPSTFKTSQGFLKNHIKPQIGSIPLADLTSLDLQRFYKHLLDGGRVDRIEAKKITQIHRSVKGIQCHIQTAAFHRLLFLFFHRFYRINCFFSFFCGVMEAACFTCRWLSDIRCSGASCL